MDDVLTRAAAIADDVLFPAAIATDAAPLLPVASLDLLAREGFYGMAGPPDVGGWDLDPATSAQVVEILAGGCLTTTFVWLQHRNPVRAVAASATPGLREEWLAPLCAGARRAGIALAGERPGPPLLVARREGDGLTLDGEAPWVSGWGLIDVVLVAAREGDRVIRTLVDAAPGATIAAEPLDLVAANASGTVTLRFDGHRVPADRIVNEEPLDDVLARDAARLRMNGSLSLGVAGRCGRLLGPGPLDEELRRDAGRARRGVAGAAAGGACSRGRTGDADGRRARRRRRRPLDPGAGARAAARARSAVPAGLRLSAADPRGAPRSAHARRSVACLIAHRGGP